MIDKQNISITSGTLSIAADNLFEDIDTTDRLHLYVSDVNNMALYKAVETQLKLTLSAEEFDQLAFAWCQKRGLI